MELSDLLSELARRGVALEASGDRLVVRAPGEGLTPALREALSHHKPRLLERLATGGFDSAAEVVRPAPADRPRRLSFAQERLWILDQLGGGAAYNLPVALRLRGMLDVSALRRSLEEIVRRHEILRTTFPATGTRPEQVVSGDLAVAMPLVDLSGLDEETRGSEARGLALEEALRPFDLARGPLLRARLVRLGETDHLMFLTLHHIVYDGWSAGILNSELAANYRALVAGQPPSLPPLRLQYGDFAHWQREWLRGESLERELAFWKARMDPLPPRLQLGSDGGTRGADSIRGAAHTMAIDKSLADALRSLARQEGVTLFVLLLAAYKALLLRYTGQQDVVVGVPVAGRNRSEIEGLIGLFSNTLPLRTDLSGDPTFRVLLERVKQVASAAFEHESLPLEKLVEELNPGREGGAANPLFQITFALQNVPPGDLELPGLTLSHYEADVRVTRFDLEMHLFDHPGGLFASVIHNPDRLDREAVEALGGHYRRLLEGAAADPGGPISSLPLLDAGETQRLLERGKAVSRRYPRNRTLGELFEEQAASRGDAVAVEYGAVGLTYTELDRRSNRLGRYLRTLGVGHGTCVGVCLERSPELVLAMLGVVKAGAAYVPLDPGDPPERLAFVAGDASVAVVLTRQSLADTLPPLDARVVRLDADWDRVAGESEQAFAAEATPDSLAYAIYTSGSTGTPKGVAVPHRAVVRLVRGTDYVDLRPSDRVVQASNASFDAATFEIWGALLNGSRLVGLAREVTLSPGDLARELREREATVLFLTTALFNRVAREDPAAFTSLRVLLFGGEAVDPRWVRAVLEAGGPGELLHVYGPTENTTFSTWHRVATVVDGATTVPIGRSLANGHAYVLDARMRPVPDGTAGELLLGGDGLARGYLRRPGLTANAFVPDPFGAEPGGRLYRTGDRVRRRRDGEIEFLGRVDDQVKLRGFRIELREIELALLEDPRVRDATVVVRTAEGGDGQLVAYLTPRGGQPLSPEALRERVRAKLPAYMVPAAFVVLPSLPLNANGKVDRRALPPPEGRGVDARRLVAPRGTLEESIAAAWREVLHLDEVGIHDNFFDVGGHSLRLIELHRKLRALPALAELRIVDLFEHPTIDALVAHLAPEEAGRETTPSVSVRVDGGRPPVEETIAIVGMAGRFPGARDVDELWRTLRDGTESIARLTDEELAAEGIPATILSHPRYVKARGVLADADRFDAGFFGYNPREAEMMDPQQRVFLEAAWTALENAGHLGDRASGRTGVFAGASINTYLPYLAAQPGFASGGLPLLVSSDKDFLTTRVSYKLDLRGPSLDVQTACSTSLVAVHLACESLRRHECDTALAGGVSVGVPLRAGYLYEADGIFSPDGHCRAFDRRAQGTLPGNGVGVVVLRRASDALRDGDSIAALIKGSAINNDGAARVGYTAPGVEGQAEVVAMAQAAAGVDPGSIGYLEAHGTGTTLGDPIEIEALHRVFGAAGGRPGRCAIGSLKTNVGHLDAAAGVAGLIKAALVLKHRQIPPSLHFESPNPKIDFAAGPFRVSAALEEWTAEAGPRRAAVSSFGMGGTNAHVVLEEAPSLPQGSPAERPIELVALSARTPTALDAMAASLAAHLEGRPELELADVAHTLQEGRRSLRHRRVVVARDGAEAVRALRRETPGHAFDGRQDDAKHGVVFLLPGQGTQHVDMGRALHDTEPVFRDEVGRCAEGLHGTLGFDLRSVLYPEAGDREEARRRLDQTDLAQPALFAVEWALGRLLRHWGVAPAAMLGHSLGELVAATMAGVFSLDDALSLVAARGRLMQQQPEGGMLAVEVPEDEARRLLDETVALAAVNGPAQCVVSGPVAAIAAVESRLGENGALTRRLRTSHAFHSPMMAAAVEAFRERVAAVERRPPGVPFVSNVTGTWITDAEAVDPGYWARHLRETVRFADGVAAVVDGGRVVLQVGPGPGLVDLVRAQVGEEADRAVIATLPCSRDSESGTDADATLTAVARLWASGVRVDWAALRGEERRRRVALPTYPFERQRYWFNARPAPREAEVLSAAPPAAVSDWFYRPTWRAAPPRLASSLEGERWLVFEDGAGLGAGLAARLEAAGRRVARVTPGDAFCRSGAGTWTVRPGHPGDHAALLRELRAQGISPERVVHLWGVTAPGDTPPLERTLDLVFHGLLSLARAFGEEDRQGEIEILAVTSGMQEVGGEGLDHPERATILGPCRVIPQEYPGLCCRSIDVRVPEVGVGVGDVDRLLAECAAGGGEEVVALRGPERWVPGYEPLRLAGVGPEVPLREGGVYVITGGLGGVGYALARFLARTRRGRLALLGRSALPPRGAWDGWLAAHEPSEPTSRRIRRARAVEAEGAEVVVLDADVTDRAAMENALSTVETRLGPIDGVIHAAGVPGGGVIALKTRETADLVLAPKVRGTLVLAEVLESRRVDFLVLCSSLAAVWGGPGQVDYCAANAFQDAFARQRSSRPFPFVLSLNWDAWREEGMAVETDLPPDLAAQREAWLATGEGIGSEDGAEAFARALGQPLSQLLVSTTDLGPRLAAYRSLVANQHSDPEADRNPEPSVRPAPSYGGAHPPARHERPVLDVPFVAPRDEVEEIVSAAWRELLGFAEIGVHDSFFDLGGHSLLATQVINRLRDTFHVPLRLETFFESPTVEGLARALAEGEARSGQTLEIARLVQSVEGLSEQELLSMLEESDAQEEPAG